VGPGESVGTPSLTPGNVNINPAGITSQQALGLPVLVATNTIIPVAIGSAEALGLPVLIPGLTRIIVGAISSAESVGIPTLIFGKTTWNWVNRSPSWKTTKLAGTDAQDAMKTTKLAGVGTQDGFARTKRSEGD
jgi:hypothetical protein